MKTIAAVLLFLVWHTAAEAQEQVTFTMQPFPEGLEAASSENFLAHLTVQAPGSAEVVMEREMAMEKQVRFTILETSGGEVSRMRVHVDNIVDVPARTGAPPEPSPLIGNSYLVKFSGDSLSAVREDGAEMSPEELLALRRGIGRDMLLHRFSRMLDGMALTKGVETPLPTDIGEELLPGTRGMLRLKSASMTLEDLHNDSGDRTAILSFHFVVEGMFREMNMDAELKGFAAVGADTCWPVSVSLQGEFGGEMQEPRKLNVVGMVTGERSLLYTRER